MRDNWLSNRVLTVDDNPVAWFVTAVHIGIRRANRAPC